MIPSLDKIISIGFFLKRKNSWDISEIEIRPLIWGDSARVLAWRNDVDTRRMSKSGAEINPSDHQKWFCRKLFSPFFWGFVGINHRAPFGICFIEVSLRESVNEISININPARRSQGLGQHLLRLSINEIKKFNNFSFKAEVKKQNARSLSLFFSQGFEEFEDNENTWTLVRDF